MSKTVSLPKAKTSALRLEAFISSEEARNAAERIQAKAGQGAAVSFHSGTLATAARLVGIASLGDVLIAEVGNEPMEATLDLVRDLKSEGVHLILLGWQDAVSAFRSYIAAGAKDYIVLPLEADTDFPLDFPAERIKATASTAKSKCIAICGASGGVGASILGQNLSIAYLDLERAGQLPRNGTGKVALIDADLDFGTLAADLEIESTSGLLDALQAPDRVDATFLNATMAEPLQGLHVYSTEADDSTQGAGYRAGLPDLLQRLRIDFPTVIVDLPRELLAEQPSLADQFDEMVLIMGPGFGAVRSTSRLMDKIGYGSCCARITCILSHTRRDAGLKSGEIAMALENPIALELPNCAADLVRAHIKGQPLQRLARKSPYARAVTRLAKYLESPIAEVSGNAPKPRRFWQRKTG